MALPGIAPTGSVSLLAGPVSARATIPTAGTPTQVVVTNFGPEPAFVVLGNASVVATVDTGFPVLPNGNAVLTLGTAVAIAAITTGDPASLRISAGV